MWIMWFLFEANLTSHNSKRERTMADASETASILLYREKTNREGYN